MKKKKKKTNKTFEIIKRIGTKIRQFFCLFHNFQMTDAAKAIPSVQLLAEESGTVIIEIREHECTKCKTTTMLSSGLIT